MTKLVLQIEGMKCGACEAHVNDAARRAANVKSVKSSAASGSSQILLEDGSDAKKIIDAIEADGYKVTSFEQSEYQKENFLKKLFKKRKI